MALFELSKEDRYREAWCEAVFGKKARFPREFTDAQLRRLTTDLLMQHDRIIRECADIIRDTEDEAAKWSRIDLMRLNYYEGMLRLKPFCNDEQLAVIEEARKIVESIL
jgi:hypothetical protein